MEGGNVKERVDVDDHAKHEWRLALRYRHFTLPQSSSASRFTAGAAGFLLLIQRRERPER